MEFVIHKSEEGIISRKERECLGALWQTSGEGSGELKVGVVLTQQLVKIQ